MQIKIFTIPILGGEAVNDEMNVFLRSKKVLNVESSLINNAQNGYWCFCVKYLDDSTIEKVKVDYRQVLDEATFKRFSFLREIRKKISQDEGVPAYAVFTDEELAGVAKLEEISLKTMKSVRGIAEKKVEKYGHHFLSSTSDEKGA